MKDCIRILLGICLGLFVGDGAVSLLDDSLILFCGVHVLGPARGILFLFSFGICLVTYALMALTPLIPKRYFLPVVLFGPAAVLAIIPAAIYQFDKLPRIGWLISLIQFLLGLTVIAMMQDGLRWRRPFVREEHLGKRLFSWWNLVGFVLVNILVLAPAVLAYLGLCAGLAVNHFSGGFVALHLDRLSVHAEAYQRSDGKTVQLVPMVHVAESTFYRDVMRSVPTNAVVLLEGVTDEKHLLKQRLSYKRMAQTLGLSEQQELFIPQQARERRADVDIDQFSPATIEFLNLVIEFHTRGVSLPLIQEWVNKTQNPALPQQLLADLLGGRNAHLFGEIQSTLQDANQLVVPWGAAHMPGLARDLERINFHLSRTQEYNVFQFRTIWDAARERARKSEP